MSYFIHFFLSFNVKGLDQLIYTLTLLNRKKDSIHPDVDERKYLIRIILGILIFAIIMSTLIPYFVIGDSSITCKDHNFVLF